MTLVRSLVRQVRGRLVIEQRHGARIEVRCSLE
jgi:two-component sensor histidine kinase